MSKEIILVVDDEANIRDLARLYLEKDGYQVVTVTNGEEALAYIHATPPALIVLDLMLPHIDGWEVCRRIRADSALPILMLTARDDDIDKIVGLEMGADDYLTKPFNPRELVARVRAVLRRAVPDDKAMSDKVRQAGNVVLNPASREVTVNGERIMLRTKEFDLLLTLMDHPNRVLTREQLLDQVWDYEYYGRTRTVDVHVAALREKLANSTLSVETVWGQGYKLIVAA